MSIVNKKLLALSVLLCVFVSAGQVKAVSNDMDQVVLHPAIPLLDEAGNHVLDSGNPYSSKVTCGTGGCHDYESITHAFHIEQGRDETSDDFGALRGLSTLVGPGYYGGFNCMGGSNPDQLAKKVNASADDFGDLGSADHIMRCISCHAGGGWMEKDRNGNRYDEVDITTVDMLDGDYYSRDTNAGTDAIDSHDHTDHDMGGIAAWDWEKSGVVENDCLMCHVSFDALQVFDPQLLNAEGVSPALTQFTTLRGTYLAKDAQFRSVNTSILEFLNLKHVDGEQEDISVVTFDRTTVIPPDVHIHTSNEPPYILNKDEAGQPLLNWNEAAFDENKQVAIPMLRFPANDNCMLCHRTSNSRRGFYGFGEGAEAVIDEDGVVVEDYQDDVHKGMTWIEPNGEERAIENCNACHTRNYYNPSYANVDLDVSHNFLKGNSDMDVRNDLDYSPNAKSCEYCHDDAPNPAIPSGHESMQAAHLEKWKASGDMAGYPQETLERITQSHLDLVSCQACHITGKKSRGLPILPMYRYRAAENGDLTIVPYNPRLRYYWKDKNSGRTLTKTERDSVYETRTDAEDNLYGVIIDPVTGEDLATVEVIVGRHGARYVDPADYETFVSLKGAFDKVLLAKGVENPDTALVWTESNQYLMSHNTRPAVSSVQCEDCHNKKQDGSFSSLLSPTGLFGEANTKEITQLVDPRLVDEGLVLFDYPYMKADETGKVTENVSDILYASRINPSMSILNAEIADMAAGEFRAMPADEAITASGIDAAVAAVLFPGNNVFAYQPRYGSSAVRGVALMLEDNGQTELMFPSYSAQVSLSSLDVMAGISDAGIGGLVSDTFSLQITDSNSNPVSNFSGARVLVKLPYKGSNTNLDEVGVVFSTDGGISWVQIDVDDIVVLKPHSEVEGEESEGIIAFWTDHFSDYAVVDNTLASKSVDQEVAASSGGGGADYVLLIGMFVMALVGCGRRRIRV